MTTGLLQSVPALDTAPDYTLPRSRCQEPYASQLTRIHESLGSDLHLLYCRPVVRRAETVTISWPDLRVTAPNEKSPVLGRGESTMARFKQGDRVYVPQGRQGPPIKHYGKHGTVILSTAAGIGLTDFNEVEPSTGRTLPIEDPPCVVRFDGEATDTDCFESWLEPE